MTELVETRVDPPDWNAHVPLAGRPQIVVGGPGTGKTQFLVDRIASAITDNAMDPAAIVVLAFSRRGATDIIERLARSVGAASNRVNVATYHSVAMRIVEAHSSELGWGRPPTVLTATEQERFIADVLSLEDPRVWPAGYRTLLDSPVMVSEVTDFILRCHEQLLGPGDLEAMGDPRFSAMAAFLRRYDEQLLAAHRTDYGRIMSEAVAALETWSEIADPYRLVIADEYQDSSPAQAEMTFLLAANTSDLVVAADPYQSIYSFRGTDINNVFRFPQEAKNRLGTDAERIVLTTSHRVPAEILDAAVAVTGRELPGGAGKVLSARSGGVVASHVFPTLAEEAEWIAADIERIHLIDGVPLENIAVFTRSRSSFGAGLAAGLERRSIPHTFAESRLADEPVAKFVHDLVTAAVGDDEAATLAIRRVLMSPYVGMGYGAVNDLARRVDDGGSWSDVITRNAPSGKPLAALLDDPAWADHDRAPAGLWLLWSTLPHVADIAIDDAFAPDRMAWSALSQVLTRLDERAPGTTLADHAELVMGSGFEADPLYSFRSDEEGGVSIRSLHDAKGTEYDIVYVANAVEGALPDLRSRDSLLGTRLLNPHLPTDTGDYVAFRLDEERRLAYTATTRATSRVVWTATMNDDEGSGSQPSRFLPLVAPITDPYTHEEPLTARSFEARLRRVTADPTAPLAERLSAMKVLAAGTDVGLSDPRARYGIRERGKNDDIRPDVLRLSPSQARSYRECPRKYAVERFLMTQPDTNDAMRFGTLIHEVLENAERGAVADGRERSSLDEAIDALDKAWEADGFGEGAIGASWRHRAEVTLETLYDKWPGSGEPIAFEKHLELTIENVDWYGRADRIERRGDELFVVDYKTSATPVTKAEAESSVQLGFYLLAAMADKDFASSGDFAGAEFWYVSAKPLKTSIATRSQALASLDTVTEELEQVTVSIKAGDFAPIAGPQCAKCRVALVCPARDEGQEAFSR